MKPENLIEIFAAADAAVKEVLLGINEWGLVQENPIHAGQHYPDVAADNAALEILKEAGLAVMSEESGFHLPSKYEDYSVGEFDLSKLKPGEFLVVMDPLDGSTNASKRIPFYAISLCALDASGPVAGYVANLACQDLPAYTAIRGEGAQYGSSSIQPSSAIEIGKATVGVSFYVRNGLPEWLKSSQRVKCLGAAALELCMVASGSLDAYLDCTEGIHSPWDYLAGSLICNEAGAEFRDVQNRNINQVGMDIRRQPLAASSVKLIEAIQNLVLKETGA